MLGPVRGEDVELMPGTPLAVDEGHASDAEVMGVPAPLTTMAVVDCVSSDSCCPVPPPCDLTEAMDALRGVDPWIFVGRSRRTRGNAACSETPQFSALHSASLEQAAAFRWRTHG